MRARSPVLVAGSWHAQRRHTHPMPARTRAPERRGLSGPPAPTTHAAALRPEEPRRPRWSIPLRGRDHLHQREDETASPAYRHLSAHPRMIREPAGRCRLMRARWVLLLQETAPRRLRGYRRDAWTAPGARTRPGAVRVCRSPVHPRGRTGSRGRSAEVRQVPPCKGVGNRHDSRSTRVRLRLLRRQQHRRTHPRTRVPAPRHRSPARVTGVNAGGAGGATVGATVAQPQTPVPGMSAMRRRSPARVTRTGRTLPRPQHPTLAVRRRRHQDRRCSSRNQRPFRRSAEHLEVDTTMGPRLASQALVAGAGSAPAFAAGQERDGKMPSRAMMKFTVRNGGRLLCGWLPPLRPMASGCIGVVGSAATNRATVPRPSGAFAHT